MPESKWLELIYTCDWDGPYMRLDGKIFPHNVKERLFDVQLPAGMNYPKCLVESVDYGATARAIAQNGDIVQLKHGDLLRPVNDKEVQKKVEKIAHNIRCAENTAAKIKNLEAHKKELSAELAKIDAELAELKGKVK